jgi:hypothetical protein
MPDLKLRYPQAHVSPASLRQKLRLSQTYIDLTRELMAMAFNGKGGADIEALLVLLCVFVGDAEGRSTTATKISSHSGIARQSVYRRLDLLMKLGKVVKLGRNYYLAQGAVVADDKGRLARILNNYWRK